MSVAQHLIAAEAVRSKPIAQPSVLIDARGRCRDHEARLTIGATEIGGTLARVVGKNDEACDAGATIAAGAYDTAVHILTIGAPESGSARARVGSVARWYANGSVAARIGQTGRIGQCCGEG